MSRTVPLLASLAAAMLLAIAVAVMIANEPAQAAFPGINAKIVFERDRDGYLGPEDPEIFTVWFDGNNLKRLTNNTTEDTRPAWSADGKKIVFSGDGRKAWDAYRADIFVMNANGSDRTRITDERKMPGASRANDLQPAFSPNGRQIVFVRNGPRPAGYDSNNDIYKIRVDGNYLTRLVNIPSYEYYYGCCPTWSPDGSKIAFYSEVEKDYRLETIRPDGSSRKFVAYDGFAPDWSPDGSRIVFDRFGEIYTIDANGTGKNQLTNHPGWDTDPAFSPSGGKIVFSSDRDGDNDLYVMDADGTDVRQLTNHPGYDASPDWQPVQQ